MPLDIGKEKEHIYSMMREVTKERRELSEIYYSLKERLDELHKLEQRGLTNLSVKGYVDLHKKVQKDDNVVAIKNIERESENAIKKVRKQTEKLEEKKDEPKFKKQIQEDKNTRKPQVKKLSTESLAGVVSGILKDHGAPMSLIDIHDNLIKEIGYHIKIDNFRNNVIYRIMKISNKIERASHGYYQYKF